MNPIKTAKLITRSESGLLSAAEVANSLLYDLVSEPELDTAFLSSIASLPDGVRQELFSLLRRIREADFHWNPFLLRTPPAPSDSTERSAQLRRVCAMLMDNL
jgi:hypothetical protein